MVFGIIFFAAANSNYNQPPQTTNTGQQQKMPEKSTFQLQNNTTLPKTVQATPSVTTQQKPVIVTKTEEETETIPYSETKYNDSTLNQGETKVLIDGKNGVKTKTYQVTYTDGKVTAKKLLYELTTVTPSTRIVYVGTKDPSSVPATTPSYPDNASVGATAICRDGTYSFSASRSGTCSHHGGVAQWL